MLLTGDGAAEGLVGVAVAVAVAASGVGRGASTTLRGGGSGGGAASPVAPGNKGFNCHVRTKACSSSESTSARGSRMLSLRRDQRMRRRLLGFRGFGVGSFEFANQHLAPKTACSCP